MTIKELCKKHINCSVCPYLPLCGDRPENYGLGEDLEVTNAIIETAKALKQEPITSTSSVTHKIAEFFSNWDGDESAKMEISVNDMREISDMFVTKCRAESKLKALQKPCEDAVSRQVIKERLSKYGFHAPDMTITEFIEDIPSVTPKIKTGHWITKPHIYGVTFCSKCGFELKINDTKFCPNCGAKMVEPQESEE